MTEPTTIDNHDETKYHTEVGKGVFSMLARAVVDFTAFVTLTFNETTTKDEAWRAAKWWIRKISRIYLKSAKKLTARKANAMSFLLPHALIAEAHASGGYHVHVVLAAPGLDVRRVARLWGASYGFAHIRTFDSSRHALSYVLKRVGRDGVFDLARELFVTPEIPASPTP